MKTERKRDDVIAHVSSQEIASKGYHNFAKVISMMRALPHLVRITSSANDEYKSEWLETLEVPLEIMFAAYSGSGKSE